MKDFSPEWVSMWLLRLLACVQAKLHCLQAKGFSPLWTRMWHFRWEAPMVEYLHWLQLWNFFPSCWSMCVFRSLVILKERLHWTHEISILCFQFRVWSIREQGWEATEDSGNWRQWRVYPITMWNHNSKSESDIIIRLLEKLTLMALHACFWPSP